MHLRFYFGLPPHIDPHAAGVGDWLVVRGTERVERSGEGLIVVLALSFALAAGLACLWYLVDGQWRLFPPSIGDLIGPLVAMVLLHEAIHLAALPRTIAERGFGIFFGGAFVSIRGAMSQARCLVVLLSPFVLISFAPLLWRLAGGSVNDEVMYLSIFNASASIEDAVKAYHVFRQVPAGAAVHFGTGALRYESRDSWDAERST